MLSALEGGAEKGWEKMENGLEKMVLDWGNQKAGGEMRRASAVRKSASVVVAGR